MGYDYDSDPRIDPRIKAISALLTDEMPMPRAKSREELLAYARGEVALTGYALFQAAMEMCDVESVVASAGLRVETHSSSVPTTTPNCPACTTSTAAV
jgi:hypothetical protein